MCHVERFLNVWIKDLSLSLDYISGLPRYVFKSHFQTTFDDKSGYDHIRLSPDSFTFVGLEWKGWHFCYDFTLWLEGQCLHLSYGWLSGYESYLLSWCSLQSVSIFTIDMSANSLYTKIYNVLSNGPIFNLLKPLPLLYARFWFSLVISLACPNLSLFPRPESGFWVFYLIPSQ